MTWSGTRFVSANMSELGDRLLLRYFDRSGSFMGRVEIPANSYANAVPSIASVGEGHIVVDYSAFVSNHLVGVGVERVLTRTIEMKSERRRPVSRHWIDPQPQVRKR